MCSWTDPISAAIFITVTLPKSLTDLTDRPDNITVIHTASQPTIWLDTRKANSSRGRHSLTMESTTTRGVGTWTTTNPHSSPCRPTPPLWVLIFTRVKIATEVMERSPAAWLVTRSWRCMDRGTVTSPSGTRSHGIRSPMVNPPVKRRTWFTIQTPLLELWMPCLIIMDIYWSVRMEMGSLSRLPTACQRNQFETIKN